MRDSRYDPHALPELLDILGHDYDGLEPRVPTIWSTHPEIRARAETSRALVADMPPRGERQVDAFEVAVYSLRTMTVQDYAQDDYPQTAVALAESLVERYPDDPRMLQLLGDAWQAMGAQRRLDPAQLTNSDKRHNRKDRARKTREQRLAEQLATDEGRAAYAENLARAEETIRPRARDGPELRGGASRLGRSVRTAATRSRRCPGVSDLRSVGARRGRSSHRGRPAQSADRQTQGEQQ